MRICPLEYLFTAPFSALTPLIFVTWVFKAERCFIQDKLTQKQCWTVASLNTTREVKCIFRLTANQPERKPTQCSQYCKTMDLMNLYIYLFCYFRHLQVRLQRSADALLRFLHKKHVTFWPFLHSRRPNFWLKTSRTNAEAQSWTVVAGLAAVSPSTPDPAVTWRMLNKC